MTNNDALFYKDKPLFGLDIGSASIKVMQIVPGNKQGHVLGYGVTTFKPEAIHEGQIIDLEEVARAAHELFSSKIIGNISTRRVVISVPAAKSYNRNVQLPQLDSDELNNAVRLEVEQYVPIPVDDLYIDHMITSKHEETQDVLIVAVPKKIVDSYVRLAKILNLELVGVETTISSAGRLFSKAENGDIPSVLIDLGSISADLTVFDQAIIVTGTVAGGGDDFTNRIASTLHVSPQEAHIIKTKYGLGVSKKQKEITEGLSPLLQQTIKEVKRMIRYFEDRSDADRKITQVVTMGGGANMPGLSEYMTNHLRIPVRTCDPWQNLDFKGLQPPNIIEKSMYVTAAGLALANPRELFK